MKRTLLRLFAIALLLIAISACNQTDNKTINSRTVLSGSLDNIADTTIMLRYDEYALLSSTQTVYLEIDSAGRFTTVITSEHPLRAYASFGKTPTVYRFDVEQLNGEIKTEQVGSFDFRVIFFYLQPGDSVHLSADMENIKESLSFSGTGTDNNMYINLDEFEFNNYKQKYLRNYYNLTFQKANDFKRIVDEQRQKKHDFLDEYSSTHDISSHLERMFHTTYDLEAVRAKIYYPRGHAGFNDGVMPDMPDDYFSFMDSVQIPGSIDDLGIGIFYSLNSWIQKKYELAGSEKSGFSNKYAFADSLLPERMSYVYRAISLNRDFRKKLYDVFNENCKYPDIAKLVKNKFSHLEGMLEGNPGPDFHLPDVNGTMISLADFKGKLVYIDLWATWCGPCIKEIPYLHALERQLDKEQIQFISISFDSAKDSTKWSNYVIDNHLSGIQLLADKKHHDSFSEQLNIKTIPRFILLDREGKIIDANAKRPSDPKLKEALIKLLNQ